MSSWSVRTDQAHRHALVLVAFVSASSLPYWEVAAQQAIPSQHVAVVTRPEEQRALDALLARSITLHVDRVPLKRALDALATSAGIPIQYQAQMVDAYPALVTAQLTNVPLRVALESVLRGTSLSVVSSNNARGLTVINPAVEGNEGGVTGTVTDAATKRPLRGATILVDNATRGVLTRDDGTFQLFGLSAGAHRVAVRMLGYDRQSQTIQVGADQTTTVNFALAANTMTLEQVVVTGTVIPTELKAVPNAITVITAKQIEERGITKIDQLFRGDVPGLFAQNRGSDQSAFLDEVTMFSRGATALTGNSAGVSDIGTTNPIKTYVDGVEMADPRYLSQIDPKSIERIEILTGPQASTIYGSNALNGVMQIFTKRGRSNTPQLTLNLLSGFVQNNFSSALTPQHDYSASVSGIEGRLSYNAGSSWNYMGPWTPAKQISRLGGFGGARLEIPTHVGRVTADVTLRRSVTQSLQRGSQYQQTTDYSTTGWYIFNLSTSGVAQPTTRTLVGQTLGVTLSYAPTSWWSHDLGLGQDVSDAEHRITARGYTRISDTTLVLGQDHTARRSFRYTTTAHLPVTSFAQVTVTTGADAWQSLYLTWYVAPQTLTGSLTGSTGVSRQPEHNTGSFFQMQLGLQDRLFLTYGLRAEWNPDFGEKAQPNVAPRYGAALTQEFGPLTAKLRASYGRSTRPPQPDRKLAQTIADVWGTSWPVVESYYLTYYGGVFDYRLANPNLGPEHQQGGEGGLELYLGNRGSLVVTRYNQTVDGLIDQTISDSLRTLIPCPGCSVVDADGYGYMHQYQYLNLASIRNQGWELQGSVNTGPLTTRGTYSWTKSRAIGVTPKYRTYFSPDVYPQYQPGAMFQYLPEHTWALGVTYARGMSNVGLNVTGTGRAPNAQDVLYWQTRSGGIRLPQNRQNMTSSSYVGSNPSYALFDLTASRRVTAHVEGVLQIQNLTDHYVNDYSATSASIGRQLKAGMRIRTP